LAAVFAEAFAKGIGFYLHTFDDVDTVAAIKRTFIVAGIAVPFNCVFGVAAAWAIAKFDFRGKTVLITLIDLPFTVSPVVAGMVYVLLFGAQGLLGPGCWRTTSRSFSPCRYCAGDDFCDLPVRRARIDTAHAGAGRTEEEAAHVLGASGWQTFWR